MPWYLFLGLGKQRFVDLPFLWQNSTGLIFICFHVSHSKPIINHNFVSITLRYLILCCALNNHKRFSTCFFRALELAMKYNVALDIVASVRHFYLQQSNRTEILPKYLSLPKQSILNSKALKDRIENEYQREREKKDNPSNQDKSSAPRANQPVST
ncbi:hypothetical protein AHF37_05713 [Paragonimus kellicotti]|nr:hypothetical protein AHF37_05713 [Paragonimus kellicotti]